MPLDPIRATQAITDGYLNYLGTVFRMKDQSLQSQIDAELKVPDRFVKGPILEATPPYETGCCLQDLVDTRILSARFGALGSARLPLARALYLHQEQAIRRVVQNHRNVVVASGTGSGKTESFLIPILNHLVEEEEKGHLGPGVRALLLYPMNALANDQVARLSGVLAHYPTITFGRYTGETERELLKARTVYRKMYRREPLPNELISREQMWRQPPHILLTNYAMLEYLLLRPDDSVFFDDALARRWRFIVIDEAHTYTGAKGIEMAMLLRRLKDRVVASEPGRLRCIATSATLGKDEQDFPNVARFAQDLFGETFEWVSNDTGRQDVISATRRLMTTLAETPWLPAPDVYHKWRGIIETCPAVATGLESLLAEGRAAGLPNAVLEAMINVRDASYAPILYEALRGDSRIARLRSRLSVEPAYVSDLSRELFGESTTQRADLVDLVQLAALARPTDADASLIPARYHLFARAVEAACLALHPSRPIYLERQEEVTIDGGRFVACEIATCRQCGATYLVGERTDSNGVRVFRQPGRKYLEDARNLEYYLLLDKYSEPIPADDDEVVDSGDDRAVVQGDRYRMCVHCGAIDEEGLLSTLCDCPDPSHVTLVSVSSKSGSVHGCPSCGARSPTGLVWRFLTGSDATASVLATAFYQQIPPRQEPNPTLHATIEAEDCWGSTAAPAAASSTDVGGQGRQLLVFSDSRQDAAFFAPYLNRTYWRILQRRVILLTLEQNRSPLIENRWRIQDIIIPLLNNANHYGLLTGSSLQEQKREIWQWVLYELMALDRRNSLEGLGCLGYSLVRPANWQPPAPLLGWGLQEGEVWALFQLLIDGFRAKGALLFPEIVNPNDEFFKPRNFEAYFRQSGSNARRHIFAWSPAKGVMNARLDFLLRLAERLGRPLAAEGGAEVLDRIWESSLRLQDPTSCWQRYFSAATLAGEGVVFRVRPEYWLLRASGIDPQVEWYYCDTCHNLTLLNLRCVCPTYRCHGSLRPCEPSVFLSHNHYRRLYSELNPVPLLAAEHTAQLTSEAASELQSRFVSGDVNVLSCSTTFELGVDVGELESVFMRNVPPSAANYVQRAGRAGRRTESTAFALTFAQRRPHDLSHFQDPKRMVSGRIGAPHVDIANEKIVMRHVFATALAEFWREWPETFGKVEQFFFRSGTAGQELLLEFLERRPAALQAALQRIVPETLKDRFGIGDWTWTQGLFGENGVMTRAAELVNSEVDQLTEARDRLVQLKKPSDYVLRFINTIKESYLLNYLSRQNVIPKYGFPVDVVNLQILHHGDEARTLELDRDLRIALSEYAPGSQVVAGGKLWTSRYLKKLPTRSWPRYAYAICDYCQCYQRELADGNQPLTLCRACGRPLAGKKRGTFVKPEFGFMTAVDPPGQPGETRPSRTFSSRTFYGGEANPREETGHVFGSVKVVAVAATDGQLAVVNSGGGAGFRVCSRCGYALSGTEELKSPHPSPWLGNCSGSMAHYHLGHEFKTDILQVRFEGYTNDRPGFWFSLLYALLEGTSAALDIDRNDLDGCLYPYAGDPARPALILYDDVPGGAGHVRRIVTQVGTLVGVVQATLARLERCECGGVEGSTSCYGCLRNYRNQFCHDDLQRGPVIQFLQSLLASSGTKLATVG